MGEICLEKYVERQPLARLLDEGDSKLADDLAARAVAAEKETGLDLVGFVGDFVADGADDDVWRWAGEGDEGGVEAQGPALENGAARQDRFEVGLREVDVVAGARGVVVSLPVQS